MLRPGETDCVFGVTVPVKSGGGGTAVPVSETACVAPWEGALSVMMRVAVRVPVPAGVKVTLILTSKGWCDRIAAIVGFGEVAGIGAGKVNAGNAEGREATVGYRDALDGACGVEDDGRVRRRAEGQRLGRGRGGREGSLEEQEQRVGTHPRKYIGSVLAHNNVGFGVSIEVSERKKPACGSFILNGWLKSSIAITEQQGNASSGGEEDIGLAVAVDVRGIELQASAEGSAIGRAGQEGLEGAVAVPWIEDDLRACLSADRSAVAGGIQKDDVNIAVRAETTCRDAAGSIGGCVHLARRRGIQDSGEAV